MEKLEKLEGKMDDLSAIPYPNKENVGVCIHVIQAIGVSLLEFFKQIHCSTEVWKELKSNQFENKIPTTRAGNSFPERILNIHDNGSQQNQLCSILYYFFSTQFPSWKKHQTQLAVAVAY